MTASRLSADWRYLPTRARRFFHRAQANALAIEARAKMRLAEEYDAAQDRGEVARIGDNLPSVGDCNAKPTAADLGLRRDEIHEARQFRDAERADPGIIDRTISGMMNTLIVFQRMGAWLRRDGALWHLSGFAKQYARARNCFSLREGPGRSVGLDRLHVSAGHACQRADFSPQGIAAVPRVRPRFVNAIAAIGDNL